MGVRREAGASDPRTRHRDRPQQEEVQGPPEESDVVGRKGWRSLDSDDFELANVVHDASWTPAGMAARVLVVELVKLSSGSSLVTPTEDCGLSLYSSNMYHQLTF